MLLVVALAAIVVSVVGLRQLLAPDQPTFADAVEAEEEGEAFRPEAQGGELEVTGDRQGTLSLTGNAQGPGFGLGGDDGRIFFQGSGEDLSVSQASYDGLDFFLDEGECVLTPGEANSQVGVVGATLECVEIRDVRDTATITLRGRVALPADLMAERDDLPEMGGSVTVGEETFVIDEGRFRLVDPADEHTDAANRWMAGPEIHLTFRQEAGNEYLDEVRMEPWGPFVEGTVSEIPTEHCMVERAHVAMMDTSTNLVEVSFQCEEVDIEGMGEVPLAGSAIVEQVVPNP